MPNTGISPSAEVLADIAAGGAAISFKAATKLPLLRIDGKSPDLSTVHRCAHHGRRGANGERVRLAYARVAGRIITTEAAVIRFVERLSDPKITEGDSTPSQWRRATDRAMQELVAAGI